MSDYSVNWLLMGIGLILMIGPWVLYFVLRKKEDRAGTKPGKETDGN